MKRNKLAITMGILISLTLILSISSVSAYSYQDNYNHDKEYSKYKSNNPQLYKNNYNNYQTKKTYSLKPFDYTPEHTVYYTKKYENNERYSYNKNNDYYQPFYRNNDGYYYYNYKDTTPKYYLEYNPYKGYSGSYMEKKCYDSPPSNKLFYIKCR